MPSVHATMRSPGRRATVDDEYDAVGKRPRRMPCGAELDEVVAADEHGRRVAGVAHRDGTRVHIEPEDCRGDEVAAHVAAQRCVQVAQQCGGIAREARVRRDRDLHHRRDQRRGHAVARDIRDEHARVGIIDRYEVVQITGDREAGS
jgi:hypothetical protein